MDKAEQPTTQARYTVADYELAEQCVSAANVVTCDGYYEVDIEKVAETLAKARATSLAAQDGLDEHFPTGLRQRPMQLATTDEVFEGPVFCDCYCGESFAGSDEQEVRQLWAEHALSAIKEQHHD